MQRIPKLENILIWLQDELTKNYQIPKFKEQLKKGIDILENKPLCVCANTSFINYIDTIEFSNCSLKSLMTKELKSLLISGIVYSKKYNCYTYEPLIEQFGKFYEDPVANEWSNNRVTFSQKESNHLNTVAALAFAIGLIEPLYDTSRKSFTILFYYAIDEYNSPNVTFYCNRKGIEDVIDKNNLESYQDPLLYITIRNP